VVLKNNKKIIADRNFVVSDAELKEHQEFIEKHFKTTFWNNAN
jgi:hypothetical protein